jgi:hypothetical protein
LTTAGLYVIGAAHQARFSEDFDARLNAMIDAAVDPARAVAEFDELALLIVLSHFAAAGRYDSANPAPAWGLEVDDDDTRARLHRYVIRYSASVIDVVTFRGIAIAPDQSIVADAEVATVRVP